MCQGYIDQSQRVYWEEKNYPESYNSFWPNLFENTLMADKFHKSINVLLIECAWLTTIAKNDTQI